MGKTWEFHTLSQWEAIFDEYLADFPVGMLPSAAVDYSGAPAARFLGLSPAEVKLLLGQFANRAPEIAKDYLRCIQDPKWYDRFPDQAFLPPNERSLVDGEIIEGALRRAKVVRLLVAIFGETYGTPAFPAADPGGERNNFVTESRYEHDFINERRREAGRREVPWQGFDFGDPREETFGYGPTYVMFDVMSKHLKDTPRFREEATWICSDESHLFEFYDYPATRAEFEARVMPFRNEIETWAGELARFIESAWPRAVSGVLGVRATDENIERISGRKSEMRTSIEAEEAALNEKFKDNPRMFKYKSRELD
nr:hypothetical protein [Candidatus Sigynarchaeota archaeon]